MDRIMFENMIRIRGSVIPFQTTYSILFASTLVIMLVFFWPDVLTPGYILGLFVNCLAVGLFLYETAKALQTRLPAE